MICGSVLILCGCGAEPVDVPAAEGPALVEVEPVEVDDVAPSFPEGALLLAEAPGGLDDEPRAVTLRWEEATDDVGVHHYDVLVDGASVATVEVPAAETEIEGVTFEEARTFVLRAVDEAGNASPDLTTSDALTPAFPEGAQLQAQVSGRHVTLRWPAAIDDVAVTAYSLQRGEDELASLEPTARSHRLPLSESEGTLTLVAMDDAGHKRELQGVGVAVELATARVNQMVLGALGDNGALNDVFRAGAVTGNSEDMLRQARGIGVATSAGGLAERGGGSGGGSGLGALNSRSLGGIASSRSTAAVPNRARGRVQIGALERVPGPAEFSVAVVSRQLRRRVRAVQNCYERELRVNPTLQGRVSVHFTILPTGNVTSARAQSNSTGSPAVASCVVNTVRRLRFNPAPVGGNAMFTCPFDFAPQP